MDVTLHHVISYVLGHPKFSAVFPGWSRDQIGAYLLGKTVDNEVVVAASAAGEIHGILTFHEHLPDQLVVETILTSNPFALPTFLREWIDRYPNSKIIGINRPGGSRTYTVRDFARLLHPRQTVLRNEHTTTTV